MSQSEIRSAQLELPADFVSVSPDLPAPLVAEANALLEKTNSLSETLEGEPLETLEEAVTDVEIALESGDEDALRSALDALTERLFDLEG